MRTHRHSALAAMLCALVASLDPAHAHHNVEEMIRQFTEKIETKGDKAEPELYYRRATEYRALRELNKAQADLEKAVAIAPGFIAAHEDLGRIHLRRGNHDRAIASLDTAIAAATTDREKASSLAVRCEILMDAGKPEEALADCEAALDTYRRGAVDWFLMRANLQAQLGTPASRRLEGLKAGHARTKSIVLYNAWVEALIDTGDYEQARPIINSKLANARLKSSWLLRRARLHQAVGDMEAAKIDLLAAIAELNTRINPKNPDITLLVDRGLAWTMLDDRSAAKRDLGLARKAGADRWVTAPLEKALGVELRK